MLMETQGMSCKIRAEAGSARCLCGVVLRVFASASLVLLIESEARISRGNPFLASTFI